MSERRRMFAPDYELPAVRSTSGAEEDNDSSFDGCTKYEFAHWLDGQLVELETRFGGFSTPLSVWLSIER